MRRAGILIAAVLAVAAACTGSAPPAPPRASASTPAPATSRTPRVRDATRAIVVHATGDVNLDPVYVSGHADNGFAYAWTEWRALFTSDDLTIVNLECPVTDREGEAQAKSYVFHCDPDGLAPMRRAGVEVANIANNHSLDLGIPALLDTRALLVGAGIEPVGAGADAREAHRPVLIDAGGRTVAVLGFSEIVPAPSWIATGTRPGFAAGNDTASMVAAVRAASRRADLVVVAIHWGIERSRTQNAAQVARARAMIDAGADAIFGSHPHVLQPLERYRGRPIFYSLGNFVWRRSWEASYRTGVAEVRFGALGRIGARIIPAYIASSGHPVRAG
jgi:poly-gamma-glutamate synthesis protein (capsule biosynthesis protein)